MSMTKRLKLSTSYTATLAALLVLLAQTRGWSEPTPSTTTTSTSVAPTTTSTSAPSSSTTSTSLETTTTTVEQDVDPFDNPVFRDYLSSRNDLVTIGVYDVVSKRTYLYYPNVRERTASMEKIDILADLLYIAQVEHRALTPTQEDLATSMIERSSNSAANVLWKLVGGRNSVDAFNTMIGFTQTFPSWAWGTIETTALDQLQLLKVIALPNATLTNASRYYEMNLMEHVATYQRFGVGTGTPSSATVGLKNGWYPETDTGWQLNSTGFVFDMNRSYLITVMCTFNPDETYGIETLNAVARFVWDYLRP